MRINLLILILGLLIAGPCYSGTIDDFEGGVDWAASPWSDQWPLWNAMDGESVTDAMSAEWYWQYNDQTAGQDYGYIEHDRTTGAAGTSSSLKATVTGGNITDTQSGATVYGGWTHRSVYITGQPNAGETFTVTPIGEFTTTFTFQAAARSGAGQVQIGSTAYETAQNMAAAINEDITSSMVHACATNIGTTAVTVSGPGNLFGATVGLAMTESASNMEVRATADPAGKRCLFETYSDLTSSVASSGLPYIYYGSPGGSFIRALNTGIVLPVGVNPAGTNRLSLWVKSPDFGSDSGETLIQTLSIGTYIGRQDIFTAGCTVAHYYHNVDLPKSEYWTKIIITENPDHESGANGNTCYTPNDTTYVNRIHHCSADDTDYPYHYLEGLNHFYIDLTGHVNTTEIPPWSIWIDEVKSYTDTRTENNEYVATRWVTYLGSERIRIGWTGRWGQVADGAPSDLTATADSYEVYYSTSPLDHTNFTSATKVDATFTRSSSNKYAGGEFVIDGFDSSQTYYFAISPTDAPTTAGFIDYEAGYDESSDPDPDTTPPTPTISTSDPITSTDGTAMIEFTCTADCDDLAGYKWRIGSAPDATHGTECTSPATVTGLSVGSNTVYIGAGDAAGNWGSDSITVIYSPVATTISIINSGIRGGGGVR